ncbi:reverse transcriptase domain, Reverse transcriptase zinc-binding domain protein [Artemisia annua]|uniref:Reverse transcriptase domain, Reverse transcriptase zinc-binding domain protein n=1 Tax=Artemisia annua TaxID=35608 RepID=A0A2U1KNM1_ARTAN|nr:reverse transcriptase domain, Reverse transcriptase zinc-binding domain protein [Artemisia annua]
MAMNLRVVAKTTDENKIAWIARDKAISSISNGGLGIGTIKSSNQSMLSKWWWGFHTENQDFWCKIIRSIHGLDGGLNDTSLIKSGPGTRFWIDTWLGGSPLKVTFPRLYWYIDWILTRLACWAWNRPIQSSLEHSELPELWSLAHLRLSDN